MPSTAAIQMVAPRPRSPVDSVTGSSEADYKMPTMPMSSASSHHHNSLAIQLPPPTPTNQSPPGLRHLYSQPSQPLQYNQQASAPAKSDPPDSSHSYGPTPPVKTECSEPHQHHSYTQPPSVKTESADPHHQYGQLPASTPGGLASTPTAGHYSSSRHSPVSQPLTPQQSHQPSHQSSQPPVPSQSSSSYGASNGGTGSLPYFGPSYDHYGSTSAASSGPASRAYTPVYFTHPSSVSSSGQAAASEEGPHPHPSVNNGSFSSSVYYGVGSQTSTGPAPYGLPPTSYGSVPVRHAGPGPVSGPGQAGPVAGFGHQPVYHQPTGPMMAAGQASSSSSSTTTAATTPSAANAPSKLAGPVGPGHTIAMAMSQNAAPGPIPATTPLVVRQDQNGVQWIAFEYSRDRVKMEYTIRCDVESVNAETLSATFKTENCVYPRACVPKEQYKGNRLHYESECNTVGWSLAELNPALRGKRGLIQRAVDSWRNSNQDPRLRSRRVRRMAKNMQRQTETRKPGQEPHQLTMQATHPSNQATTHPGHRLSLPGMPSMQVFPQSYSQPGYGFTAMTVPSSGPSQHLPAMSVPAGSSGGRPIAPSMGSYPAGPLPASSAPLPSPARHGVESGMFSRT